MTSRWRMQHPDKCAAIFSKNHSGTITRTIYGHHITNHCKTSPITRSVVEMRGEWDRLTKRGFVYNGD